LGCELHELLVTSDTFAARSFDQMRQLADQVVHRVRYLLEPLQVQEVDRERAAIQLRSAPPEHLAGGERPTSTEGKDASSPAPKTVRYYEVLLERDHGLRLVRYEKPPHAARRQVPVQVSCQTLQKLCQDLVDLVGAMPSDTP
jgi:hypothetical protein